MFSTNDLKREKCSVYVFFAVQLLEACRFLQKAGSKKFERTFTSSGINFARRYSVLFFEIKLLFLCLRLWCFANLQVYPRENFPLSVFWLTPLSKTVFQKLSDSKGEAGTHSSLSCLSIEACCCPSKEPKSPPVLIWDFLTGSPGTSL